MIVLSLFDWISCARVALQRAWFDVERYFASEIDQYAIKVSEKNRSEICHIWDVKEIVASSFWQWKIDLLIWWSPCQDLSIAKKNRQWLDGEKSWLFREYVRILKETKPKRFVLENVASMPKDAQKMITETLGVEPIMINASLVSAQSRKRLFRTNIPGVTLPEDKWILLKDIIEDWSTNDLKSYCVLSNYQRMTLQNYMKWQWQLIFWASKEELVVPEPTKKWYSIANEWDSVDVLYPTSKTRRWRVSKKARTIISWSTNSSCVFSKWILRKLTPVECERLQCLPDEYTAWISNSQRYKCLWNAFNVDVVAHILSFIPKK